MNVVLRGDELNLYVVTRLAEFFLEGASLSSEIGLSEDIVTFTTKGRVLKFLDHEK
jgi:hypothetical protein